MTKRRSIIDDMREELTEAVKQALPNAKHVHICDKQQIIELAESSRGILMGAPVGTPGYKPRAGFKQVTCETCHCQCWIGPRQLGVRANEGWPIICMACCALAGLHEHPGYTRQHLGG